VLTVWLVHTVVLPVWLALVVLLTLRLCVPGALSVGVPAAVTVRVMTELADELSNTVPETV
jgi:hypothetical protein